MRFVDAHWVKHTAGMSCMGRGGLVTSITPSTFVWKEAKMLQPFPPVRKIDARVPFQVLALIAHVLRDVRTQVRISI